MNISKPVVAIIENDLSLLNAVKRLLIAFGFAAETYVSAELFLERPNKTAVDCLLLDINLDGISGLELQRRLVEKGIAPPIIFITGRSDDLAIGEACDQGCFAFLHKPFTSDTLRSLLDSAMRPHYDLLH